MTNRRSWARFTGTLLASSVLVVASASCKPKVGGACKVGQAVCEDTSNVMACQGGVFVEAHCRGAGGCSKLGSKISCDDSVSDEGDTCLENESENHACSVDKKKSLICEGGKFKMVQYCRGPKACVMKGETPVCDVTLAEKGEPCATPGINACTSDAKTRVICKDGKWAFDRICRGAQGCMATRGFECDESLSEIGDPCGKPGMLVCSVDEKDELQCQGGQFVKSRECRKQGCHVMQNRITCQ